MFRSRIFWRLFLAYSFMLAVSLGLLGWLLIHRMETHLLQEVRRDLETKTILIRELAARQSPGELQGQMARLAQETGTRITLIRADGTVLADSSEQPNLMENHLDRTEVQEAETSGIGVATRYSGTVHLPLMYLACRNDMGPVRYVRLALPLETLAQAMNWLHRVIWTTIGLTLLVTLILSWFIARRITAPLVELTAATDSIARGAYGRKVLISSADEVGILADSFNKMSQACAAHITQMDQDRRQLRAVFGSMVEGVLVLDGQQTIGFINDAACQLLGVSSVNALGRKIWEVFRHRQLSEGVEKVLTQAEPNHFELTWLNVERKIFSVQGASLPPRQADEGGGAVLVFHDITHLRKLERVRQDFVANVSHELKTPLAVIQATVETLLDGALHDPDHNVRFLQRIQENATRLHALVHDLLTLGRIESGQETMELQPGDLGSAIAACIGRQAVRAQSKELELIQPAPTTPVMALVDEEVLAEILDNLVDNAIKYTPPAGKITLRCFAQEGNAVLQVEDTGVGIPEKDLPRIFERFYRVDKARSRELGGTGLGLSIVKHLVQSLNGTITAASQPGTGSTFTIKLPLAKDENPPRPPRRVVFVCVENSNRSQMAEAFARIHGQGRLEPYSAGSRPSGQINPRAVAAMRELGYDLQQHRSKGLADLPDVEYDLAITMGCGDECPYLRARQREDWAIPDPKNMPPEQFRTVRDLIEQKVKDLLAALD